MQLNFETDNVTRARAALLLYAIYRSRDKNSSLNGLETWNRLESYCKGACRKSSTTSEFVTKFKEMSKTGAIKPKYLTGGTNGMQMLPDGTIVESSEAKEFHTEILEDDSIRDVIEKEYPLIVMLVRERIQREKFEIQEEENEED